MSKSKPVHEVRLGRVRAAIWENETSNGARHNVTFSRLYRDEQGKLEGLGQLRTRRSSVTFGRLRIAFIPGCFSSRTRHRLHRLKRTGVQEANF